MVMHETTVYTTAVVLCSVQLGRGEEHMLLPQGFDTKLQYSWLCQCPMYLSGL
jgi:hypothetical protein